MQSHQQFQEQLLSQQDAIQAAQVLRESSNPKPQLPPFLQASGKTTSAIASPKTSSARVTGTANKVTNSATTHQAEPTLSLFQAITNSIVLAGSPLAADNKLSIPLRNNDYTVRNWGLATFQEFLKGIGYQHEQIEQFYQQAQQLPATYFQRTQETLRAYQELNQNGHLAKLLENDQLMHKWSSLVIATQDAVFPPDNLHRLAQQLKQQTFQLDRPHLITVIDLINFLQANYGII